MRILKALVRALVEILVYCEANFSSRESRIKFLTGTQLSIIAFETR